MQKLTKNQINQIKRLRVKGHTFKEIEAKTDANYQQVRYHASKVEAPNEEPKVKKDVTPKKIVPPIQNNVTMNELQEHMTGYLDGLAIRHNMPRADIDRIMFRLLELPLSVRLFG